MGNVKITGLQARHYQRDTDEVLKEALKEWDRTQRREDKRAKQVIEFDRGPIGLALMADLHFGSPGTDYGRVFADAELIAKTEGMYAGTVGDLVDNFILAKLAHARRDNRLLIEDEWTLVKKFMSLIGPKLLLAVGGNHDYWTRLAAGIDFFTEILNGINPDALYDEDDSRVTIKIGAVSWPGRIRHKWRGASIYNETHGIERAGKWDHDFVWGVGAHTHVSGLARQFNNSGENGLALLCGAYKRVDKYARSHGFVKANQSAAVAIIFDERNGSMQGFNDLNLAARILTALRAYGRKK